MNRSRMLSGLAALAIGFGVTLVGVAAADDAVTPSSQSVDLGDDRADEPEVSTTAVAESDEVENQPTPRDTEQTDPPNTTASSELPGNTPQDPPITTATTSVDDEKNECVETLSVVYDDGEQADYVVVESGGGASYRVLDMYGEFSISIFDIGVEELVIVEREVVFDGGVPLEYLDVCDVGRDTDVSDPGPTAEVASLSFPCSDDAHRALRASLGDADIQTLDDIDEFKVVLALELAADVGRRDVEAWFRAIDEAVVAFRTFGNQVDGCPVEIESGFGPVDFYCTAARLSADDRLFQLLDTVVPSLMNGCTYELDQDGEI